MNIPKLLEGQVAVVTGASRGIGQATALTLAQAGAAVVLAARSADQIASVADRIKHEGGRAVAVPTDVSDVAEVDHMLVLALRAFGRIDILVNNAALVQPLGKVWETSPLAWQQLVAVNVVGPYLCSRVVLPHMLEKGAGRIINISSGAAEINLVGASAYNASKAALERFSGTLAAEVEGTGIKVSAFRPGIVNTQMQRDIRHTPTQQFPRVDDWQAWHRNGQLRPPHEPSLAILWLASRFAADVEAHLFSLDDPTFRQRLATDLQVPLLPARRRNGG